MGEMNLYLDEKFQFTHPVRGATRNAVYAKVGRDQVSIHAPREGCDPNPNSTKASKAKFQFTHPVRGATSRSSMPKLQTNVSIHAPREGCDRDRLP